MTAAAIAGSFANYRLIRSRSVLVVEIEVPVERQAEVFAALGYPLPGVEIPVAVARLSPSLSQSQATGAVEPARGTNTPPSSQTLGTGVEGDENRGAHQLQRENWVRGEMAMGLDRDEAAYIAGQKAVTRAGILCRDGRFQLYAGVRPGIDPEIAADIAAAFLRTRCQIASRRDMAHDEGARERFDALCTEFDIWRGRLPEQRG